MNGAFREIKAIVQPYMLEHVLNALEVFETLPGVTVSKVLGWGRRRVSTELDAVQEAGHSFGPKIKLEIVVPVVQVDRVVAAIVQAARTGKPGDGKVFVLEVADVVKVRTGEHGELAL